MAAVLVVLRRRPDMDSLTFLTRPSKGHNYRQLPLLHKYKYIYHHPIIALNYGPRVLYHKSPIRTQRDSFIRLMVGHLDRVLQRTSESGL